MLHSGQEKMEKVPLLGGGGVVLWSLWDSKMWFQTNTLINSHVEFSPY